MYVKKIQENVKMEREVYVANDGMVFDKKDECEQRDELIEMVSKMEIKSKEGVLPLDAFGNGISAGESDFLWYKLKSKTDYDLLKQVYDNMEEPISYPDIMCVESNCYSGENWGYLLSDMKKATIKFWSNFGMEIELKATKSADEEVGLKYV